MQQALHYADLYNWADAGPFFAKAEKLYRAKGDTRNTLYAHIGAIRATMERRSLPRTSEELSRELETNPLLRRDAALRMFCLSVKGDIDGEIDAAPMKKDWAEVRSLAAGFGDAKWRNRASAEIGFAEFMEGHMDQARAHVAGALIQAARTHDLGAQIRYLAAIGTGMVLVRNYEAGLDYLQKALQISAKVPDAGYPFLAKEGNLQALLGLGKIDEAQKLGAEIIREAQKRRKLVKETQARITLARVELAAHKPTDAISQLQTAIRLAETGGFPRLLADAKMILADIYGSQGRLQLAQKTAQQAIAVTRKDAEPYLLPQRLTSLAALQVRQGRYADAERSYEQAGYLVDSMLGNVSSIAAKTSLITTMTDLYVGEFSLLADNLHRPDQAFLALESARGRILRDLLLQGERVQSPQEESVERRVSELRVRLAATSSEARAKQLRDQIFLAEQTRWLIDARAKWPVRNFQPLASADVRRHVGPDELILEYVLADSRSYCLSISNQGLGIAPLPPREVIEKDIEAYADAIKNRNRGIQEAKRLYADLLWRVPGLSGHSKLIVVPDGKLFLVPFDALMDGNGEYVLARYAVSYAPSASTFALMRSLQSAQDAPRSLLAVGGVPYRGQQGTTRGVLRPGMKDLGDLPGSKEEVEIASAADDSIRKTILVDSNATEAAVKHADLEHRSIVHLAVHGVADPVHPDHAAMVLLSDSAAHEDGLLESTEISNMRLNADVVVLSACDTAVGRLQGEAGIANLSRAFLLAGAHSVVSTLWSVDDTFSVFMMKQFYSHLMTGDTVGAALAQAKRDVLKTYGNRAVPYFWAGYVVDGVSDQRARTSKHKQYAAN
jgi:CHAT domain-containing protein/tetratricopeptide (TPR) repeat protein